MRRKAKARKRALAQQQARAEKQLRQSQTAAARAAHSARRNPEIRAHDALVLPTIRRLRSEGLSWVRIAGALAGLVDPPGCRGRYQGDRWHATAVWRIARRHGIATTASRSAQEAR